MLALQGKGHAVTGLQASLGGGNLHSTYRQSRRQDGLLFSRELHMPQHGKWYQIQYDV